MKWERLWDTRIVFRILAKSLSPSQGGSDLRNPESTGKLQILQQMGIRSAVERKLNLSKKDSPLYVGMIPCALRLDEEKDEKENKSAKSGRGEKTRKQKKNSVRKVED